jgi:hypothetical protein
MTTSSKSPFVIGEIEGYSKDFSTLISMMDYTRETTIRAVQDLSVEALDYRINGTGNSIGMLLAHLVAVEKIYQYLTTEGKDLPDEEIERYADTLQPALDLGEAAIIISGNPAEFYLEDMQKRVKKRWSSLGSFLIHGSLKPHLGGRMSSQTTILNGFMFLKTN